MSLKASTLILSAWVLAAAAPAHAACYRVFKGPLQVFGSQEAPVDLSRSLSETVPQRFGAGASMVIVPAATECPNFDLTTKARSPVLDDSRVGSTEPAGSVGAARGSRKSPPAIELDRFFNGRQYNGG